MTIGQFFQIQLRTSDVEAAPAFYGTVLGASALQIVQLHEQAVARGARPHWLGYLEVADVAQAAEAFADRGATSLGPPWINPEGLEGAVMRDPGGAVVALARPPAHARREDWTSAQRTGADVIWHVLNTADVTRAKANYGELFGWEFPDPIDLGSLGVLHPFIWERGAAPAGALIDIAGRPGVHPHWLFHFRAAALDATLSEVRDAGGTVIGPLALPNGVRIAVCEDPQGAAFALHT